MSEIDILQEIRDDVRSMRAEMTGMLTRVTALDEWRKATEKAESAAAIEPRVRALENGKAWLLGAAAGVAAVASLVVSMIMKAVGK